jgi:O-antigen/teichoic acid export membrane protein
MDVARKVARNTLYNASALLIGNISGLFLTILLARILMPENFGIYSLALSIAMLAIAFSNLGIDGAVVRYTAFYTGKDLKKVRGHLHYFFKIKIFLTLTVSAILIFSSRELASFFRDEELTLPFMIAGGIVFFASLANFFNSFFIGLQEFRYYFLKQIIYELSRWIFALPLALLFFASGALAGHSIAFFMVFLFLFFMAILRYGKLVRGERSEPDRASRKFIGFMTVAGISGIIYTYVDSVMIGYFLGATQVGFYRAGYVIVFALIGLVSSLSNVLFPTFTRMNDEEIEMALGRLIRYTSLIAFPFSMIIFYLSKEIILVVYGSEYLDAVPAMTILAFFLIPGAFNYLVVIFNAKERADVTAYMITASMVLNVFLNYVLILSMGIAGAALATLLSRFFLLVGVVILLSRLFEIKPDFKISVKPLLSSTVMLLILLYLPPPRSLMMGLFEVLFAGCIYLSVAILLGSLRKADIEYFINIIRG